MARDDPSPLILQIEKNANQTWPGRNKREDGKRGDEAHQASVSDHNTGDAVDLTDDPAHGANGDRVAAYAIRDPRVKYVIWKRRIYNKEVAPGWRPYEHYESKPHDKHVHISIFRAARADTSPMAFSQADPPPSINIPGEPLFEDCDPLDILAKEKAKKKADAEARKAKQKADAEARKAKSKSKSKKTSNATQSGVHVYDGEPTLMLGDKQWMAAHVESPHTAGGRIAKGSPTVFVSPEQHPFARKGDPTTDDRVVKDGQHDVLLG